MSLPWEEQPNPLPPPGPDATPMEVPEEQFFVVNVKGLNTLVPGRLMPDGQAVEADRVWIKDGILRRSLGSQELGDHPWQAASLNTPLLLTMFRKHNTDGTSTKRWIAIVGGAGGTSGRLYEYDGAAWQQRTTGLTIDPYDAAQYQNKLYITNGTTLKTWDGSAVAAWELGVASASPPVAVHDSEITSSLGNLIGGQTYKFGYSFYSSSDGDETLVSDVLTRAFVSAGTENTWVVTIPTPHTIFDPKFDKIRYYRSVAGGTDLKFETMTDRHYDASNVASGFAIGDEIGDAWVGSKADSNLGLGPKTALNAASPPPGRGVAVWDDRLWLCGMDNAPATLAFSERGFPNNFPLTNTLVVDQYDGFGFTGIKVFQGRLYAFRQRTSYMVQPEDTTGIKYAVRRLESGYGLCDQRAVVEAVNKLFGLGYGVFWTSDGSIFTEISYPWSEQVKSLSTGAGWEAPVYLAFDPLADRRRIMMSAPRRGAVTQQAAFIDTTGEYVKWAATENIVSVGERSDGSPWIVSFSRDGSGNLTAQEWFNDSDGDAIYEEDIAAEYETRDIDPDPKHVNKLFIGFDLLLGRPPAGQDGRIDWEVFYDSNDNADESGNIASYGDMNKSSRYHRETLQARNPYETIRFKFRMSQGYPSILVLRLWFKPIEDRTVQ